MTSGLIELVYIAEKRSDSIDADILGELLGSIQARSPGLYGSTPARSH